MANLVEIARFVPPLTTEQYVTKLNGVNLRESGLLMIDRVDLDPELFVDLINKKSRFQIVPSSDGLISTVIESDTTGADLSRQTGFFDLHTDGLYYPRVPRYTLLYCVKPGNADIPTVFADTREIIRGMKKDGQMENMRRSKLIYIAKDGTTVYPRPFLDRHPSTREYVLNTGARAFISSLGQYSAELDAWESLPLDQQSNLLNSFERNSAQAIFYQHRWSAGDCVLFDNSRYIHGRGLSQQPFARDAERELKRIWLEKKGRIFATK